ncbi:hypothetical protein KI387_000640 [Taxus chinensis]|uniref:Uncharacterized protein n=1 Tax=Taxus chinensis TaxID=29808 RepID=A0AA38GV82_TAXCH|nr:hypothetical protein KI387_000640 [Taxus chinensis]
MDDAEQKNHTESHLFSADVAIHRALLGSSVCMFDPLEANFFFVPVRIPSFLWRSIILQTFGVKGKHPCQDNRAYTDSSLRVSETLSVLVWAGSYEGGINSSVSQCKNDMFRGSMRLAVDFDVKEDNNLSLVEYELVNVQE